MAAVVATSEVSEILSEATKARSATFWGNLDTLWGGEIPRALEASEVTLPDALERNYS